MVELSTGANEDKKIKNILYDLGVVKTVLNSSLKALPEYDEELDDYLEDIEVKNVPVAAEEEKPEPIGYTNYSESLDDMGGLLDE
jgi:DNA-directed RNA polymerase subunit B"